MLKRALPSCSICCLSFFPDLVTTRILVLAVIVISGLHIEALIRDPTSLVLRLRGYQSAGRSVFAISMDLFRHRQNSLYWNCSRIQQVVDWLSVECSLVIIVLLTFLPHQLTSNDYVIDHSPRYLPSRID